jgi:hypothetical protein
MYHQEWASKSSEVGYRRFIANMYCSVDWDEATISRDYEYMWKSFILGGWSDFIEDFGDKVAGYTWEICRINPRRLHVH